MIHLAVSFRHSAKQARLPPQTPIAIPPHILPGGNDSIPPPHHVHTPSSDSPLRMSPLWAAPETLGAGTFCLPIYLRPTPSALSHISAIRHPFIPLISSGNNPANLSYGPCQQNSHFLSALSTRFALSRCTCTSATQSATSTSSPSFLAIPFRELVFNDSLPSSSHHVFRFTPPPWPIPLLRSAQGALTYSDQDTPTLKKTQIMHKNKAKAKNHTKSSHSIYPFTRLVNAKLPKNSNTVPSLAASQL